MSISQGYFCLSLSILVLFNPYGQYSQENPGKLLYIIIIKNKMPNIPIKILYFFFLIKLIIIKQNNKIGTNKTIIPINPNAL